MLGDSTRIDAAVVDQLGVAVIVCDLTGTILDCNQGALELYGLTRDEVIGAPGAELAGVPLTSEVTAEIASILAAGKTWAGDFRIQRADGRTVVVHTVNSAVTDANGALVGVVSVSLDITQRVLAEQRLAVRSAITDVLEEAIAPEDVGHRILEILCTVLKWDVGALWAVDEDSGVIACVEQWSKDALADSSFVAATAASSFEPGVGLPGRVWLGREPAWVVDVTRELTYQRARAAAEADLHQGLAVPFFVDGAVVGVIELYASGAEHPDVELLELVSAIGGHLGQFMERKRAEDALREAYERATHLAQTLQQSLLPPDLPAIPGVEVAARYQPGETSLDVAGDFYDVFDTGGDWAVVIGDVCGKGAPAAALTALARHTVRAAAMRLRHPSGILRLVNDAIVAAYDDERFCTVLFTRLVTTVAGARLVISSGGHPLPYVVRSDGTVEEAGVPGTLLGSLVDVDLSETVVDLGPGDLFVAFTDGVVEARRDGTFFDAAELSATLHRLAGRSADDSASALLDAVLEFGGGSPGDDIAIVVLRVLPRG